MGEETIAFLAIIAFFAIVGIAGMYFISKPNPLELSLLDVAEALKEAEKKDE